MERIVIINYGLGNLRSVLKAVEYVSCDKKVMITDNAGLIRKADRVIFPGQGAARDCMAAISNHNIERAVREVISSKPFLGICMGLQVLMNYSEENNGTELLGIIPGKVTHFNKNKNIKKNQSALKVPHIGWNRVYQQESHPLWKNIENGARFYFVHSYFVIPEDKSLITATTNYGGHFAVALTQNNLFAIQFHPEKSANIGLRLLKNFINWKP